MLTDQSYLWQIAWPSSYWDSECLSRRSLSSTSSYSFLYCLTKSWSWLFHYQVFPFPLSSQVSRIPPKSRSLLCCSRSTQALSLRRCLSIAPELAPFWSVESYHSCFDPEFVWSCASDSAHFAVYHISDLSLVTRCLPEVLQMTRQSRLEVQWIHLRHSPSSRSILFSHAVDSTSC